MVISETFSPNARKSRREQSLALGLQQVEEEIQRSVDRADYLGRQRFLEPWRVVPFLHRQHLRIAKESRARKMARYIELIHERTGLYVEPALGFSKREFRLLAGRSFLPGKNMDPQFTEAYIRDKQLRFPTPEQRAAHPGHGHGDEGNLKLHPQGFEGNILGWNPKQQVLAGEWKVPAEMPTQEFLEHEIEHLEHKIHSTPHDKQKRIDQKRLDILKRQLGHLDQGAISAEKQDIERDDMLQRYETYASFDEALRQGVILLEDITVAGPPPHTITISPQAQELRDIMETVRDEFTHSIPGRVTGTLGKFFHLRPVAYASESFLSARVRAAINTHADADSIKDMLHLSGRSNREIARALHEQIREARQHTSGLAELDAWLGGMQARAVGDVVVTHVMKYPRSKLASLVYDIPGVRGIYDYGASAVRNARTIALVAAAIGVGAGIGSLTITNPWFWGVAGAALVAKMANHMYKRKVLEQEVQKEVLERKRSDTDATFREYRDEVAGDDIWKQLAVKFTTEYKKRQIYDRLFRKEHTGHLTTYEESADKPFKHRDSLAEGVGTGDTEDRIGLLDRAEQVLADTVLIMTVDNKTGNLEVQHEIPAALHAEGKINTKPLWEENLERALAMYVEITARLRAFEKGNVSTPFTQQDGRTIQETVARLSMIATNLITVINTQVPQLQAKLRNDLVSLQNRLAAGEISQERYDYDTDRIVSQLVKFGGVRTPTGQLIPGNPILERFIRNGQVVQEALDAEVEKVTKKIDPTKELFGIKYWGKNLLNSPEMWRALVVDRIWNAMQMGMGTAVAMLGGYFVGHELMVPATIDLEDKPLMQIPLLHSITSWTDNAVNNVVDPFITQHITPEVRGAADATGRFLDTHNVGIIALNHRLTQLSGGRVPQLFFPPGTFYTGAPITP